ncbi:pilus assembly protein Flp/PilA [Altererythrobacter atlanticus]|uniref:Flp/Fap pilin component n=1 Tax=Croceibacterium atlanticum TaxID=1267766 RepID=A0A0F7KQB0_9SPHN|nr:Flp family type IVb pilin [Croceibacterium atlanticum]AKH41311.1 Flp/Fap pilin component [Croceibacterium atlanticum]MBB5732829.1 pilus assembly protein Flp/PilA [Croceibacterium atlanticum]
MWARMLADQDGATAIEYGLILALIAMASIIAFQTLGLDLTDIFTTISDTLAGANDRA